MVATVFHVNVMGMPIHVTVTRENVMNANILQLVIIASSVLLVITEMQRKAHLTIA